MVSVLLYGAECWKPLSKHLHKLDTLYNRCLRVILNIAKKTTKGPSFNFTYAQKEIGRARANISESNEVET